MLYAQRKPQLAYIPITFVADTRYGVFMALFWGWTWGLPMATAKQVDQRLGEALALGLV